MTVADTGSLGPGTRRRTSTEPAGTEPAGTEPAGSIAVRRRRALVPVLLGCVAALVATSALSVLIGNQPIPAGDVVTAIVSPADADPDTVAVVRGLRVPRTLLGLLVGSSLGLAGGLMQGVTRNPLADPGLLGVSAGAAFGTVVAVAVCGLRSPHGFVWFAMAGALLASVFVYTIGAVGRSGTTPVKLALAGVAVTALLSSLTSGIALRDQNALDRFRFWAAGSLSGRDGTTLLQIAPFLAVGAVLALLTAPALNNLALGDDIARSLGNRLAVLRVQAVLAVTLLTGGAVATAGPIVFLGLVVPHLARAITGPDYRWILPCTVVLSPVLLLGADILGRVIDRPNEFEVGVVAAFLGAPVFIALVRRRRLADL